VINPGFVPPAQAEIQDIKYLDAATRLGNAEVAFRDLTKLSWLFNRALPRFVI
jgi:hypothetical protein